MEQERLEGAIAATETVITNKREYAGNLTEQVAGASAEEKAMTSQLAKTKMELMQMRTRSTKPSHVELATAEMDDEPMASLAPRALTSTRIEPSAGGDDFEAIAEAPATGRLLVVTGIIKSRPKIGPTK